MLADHDPTARRALAPFEETLAAYRAATARVGEDDAKRAAAFQEYARERDQRDSALVAEATGPATTPGEAAKPARSTIISMRPGELAATPRPVVPKPPPIPVEPAPVEPAPADRPQRQRAVMSFRPPDVEPKTPPRDAPPSPKPPPEDEGDMSERTWLR